MQISHNWACKLCKLKLPFLFSFRLIPPPLQILVDATFSSNLAYSLLRAISHQVIEEEEGRNAEFTGWEGQQGGGGGDVHSHTVSNIHCTFYSKGDTEAD